jgi:hypothetical protein
LDGWRLINEDCLGLFAVKHLDIGIVLGIVMPVGGEYHSVKVERWHYSHWLVCR